ncbi:hypothetical protein PIROE2DRAFT_14869 [Piromyces sp. E2]|nr:hypothetical protein PIROE2DRAFT_14869 [Piromyces sp. E2]|eukprot:OUM59566.1 hypothetical protein PIROE2DRAFT_14869 [Piromyces sp. E2]
MVFSYTNNLINDSLKVNNNKKQNNNVIDNNKKHTNIKTVLNFDKNCNNNDNVNDNINEKINQKDIKNTIKPFDMSKKFNSNMNNNNYNNFIKDSIKKNNGLIKNEKINKLTKLPNIISNESKQNYNNNSLSLNDNQLNIDKKKISKKVTNTTLKKEKDTVNINNICNSKEKEALTSKSNEKSINNKNNNNETIKKNDYQCNGPQLIRPVIKRRALFIPTISDNKRNENLKVNVIETKNIKNKNDTKNNSIKKENNSDSEKPQHETESMTHLGSLKSTLSNSQATLIANAAFKTKKELTNKRIVRAISKYKPVINIPSPNNLVDGTFHIYKSAHLDFCRNCLIPKDVLYFQGLLLFKNMSKLKGMNLSRQQINNALEWEVIKYTVFNSKSPDNWTSLLSQCKNDRTSTKILSKRYAARKQSQKCIKKETENFERKFIAYNIIKKKAPGVIDYYNSLSEQELMNEMKKSENKIYENNKINNNDNSDENKNLNNSIKTDQDNNYKDSLYSDIGSIDDYKRIFSKVVEQRVKVNAKNWTAKSSPLKESSSINYSIKIIKNNYVSNKNKKRMITFDVNDTKNFTAYIYPSKLIKDSKFCTLTNENEKEIITNLLNCNITLINNLYNNIKEYNFNSLISYYLYYLLSITYISLPYMKTKRISPTGLDIPTAEKLFVFLINLIYENLYDFNDNYTERFIKFVNYIAKVNSVESEPTPTLPENETLPKNNLLLEASEISKLICIRYIVLYLQSPKNKLASTVHHSKKSKLIHLEFMPKISYATNLLNIKHLNRNKNYRTFKKIITRSRKEGFNSVNINNNEIIKINHYIWNINNNKDNIIISYFNGLNNNNSLIDTVYPSHNKEYNYIKVPQVNNYIDYKNLAIYNHHQINNENQIVTTFFTKSTFNDNNNYVNKYNHKTNILLPILNNNNNSKPLLSGYRKIIMNSYITFPSLRQRKAFILSNNSNNDVDDDCEEKRKNFIDKPVYRNKQFGKF